MIVEGDRYGFGLKTVVCLHCGLVFTNPRPSESWFTAFYRSEYRQYYEAIDVPNEQYLQRDWIKGRHTRNLSTLERMLPKSGRLLDIGCAEGSFLQLFRERLPSWEVHGIEPSETFSHFARTYYGLTTALTGSIEDLPRIHPQESFDVITASHVLEHLLAPHTLFDIARQLLKTNGLLFIDVPDANGTARGINNLHIGHVYHFSEQSLDNFFDRFGFQKVFSQKGVEVPVSWTFQSAARKLANAPQTWQPKPSDPRKVARDFSQYCRTPLKNRVIRHIARLKRRCLNLARPA